MTVASDTQIAQPTGIFSRAEFIAPYLSGLGLEIGALHFPQPVPEGVGVIYVDRLSLEELRSHYPELSEYEMRTPDIINDGETLPDIADGSQNFVIANHFLEHCEDPIGTLLTFHRVLRPRGIAFLTIPDKRFTFDRDRPVTTLTHLQQDHELGPALSRAEHYREWIALADKIADPVQAAAKFQELTVKHYSIHFHVWTDREILELLSYMETKTSFCIEAFQRSGIECMAVLRKR